MQNTPDPHKSEDNNEELRDIMFAISQRFQPAATTKEANATFTTAEFAEKIKQHFPLAEFLDDSEVYKLLKAHGYTYAAIGPESKLEWLVFKA